MQGPLFLAWPYFQQLIVSHFPSILSSLLGYSPLGAPYEALSCQPAINEQGPLCLQHYFIREQPPDPSHRVALGLGGNGEADDWVIPSLVGYTCSLVFFL